MSPSGDKLDARHSVTVAKSPALAGTNRNVLFPERARDGSTVQSVDIDLRSPSFPSRHVPASLSPAPPPRARRVTSDVVAKEQSFRGCEKFCASFALYGATTSGTRVSRHRGEDASVWRETRRIYENTSPRPARPLSSRSGFFSRRILNR